MDSIQRLFHVCAGADFSEADEACRSHEQSLAVLREIIEHEGPGAIADMYERAAWANGATVSDTEAVFQSVSAARRAEAMTA
jgi:hypothetical protein